MIVLYFYWVTIRHIYLGGYLLPKDLPTLLYVSEEMNVPSENNLRQANDILTIQ